MANKLWWGYRNGDKFRVFQYHPASEQWETINQAEKSTFDVFYPFEAIDEKHALKLINQSFIRKRGGYCEKI